MSGRTLVMGDIHGAFKAMKQVLDRSGFSPQKDRLVCLGDVPDGWPETFECIEYLLNVPNLIYVMGNHDYFILDWIETGFAPPGWENQGGKATMESYCDGVPANHRRFYKKAPYFYTDKNRLYVHAGIIPGKKLEDHTLHELLWDRKLFQLAFPHVHDKNPPQLTTFKEIYIGHTPVSRYHYNHPVKACEVWCMDTGAGWGGPLSIIDVDTKEYWTSDPVKELYPNHKGRG